MQKKIQKKQKKIHNLLKNYNNKKKVQSDQQYQEIQIQQADIQDEQSQILIYEQNSQNRKKFENPKKTTLAQNMLRMEQNRQERREKMIQMKQEKLEREQQIKESKKNVDPEFEYLVNKERLSNPLSHQFIQQTKLTVIVRKRPISQKEEEEGEIDSVSCSNPIIRIHEPKYKIDGITKYVENHDFQFDNAFSENQTTDDIYKYSLQPIINTIFQNGVVTCFAYGQTGSGKTFTMKELQKNYVSDIFKNKGNSFDIFISFYEIYGGKCYDLLNERNQLQILEDKNNNIQVNNLMEVQVNNQEEVENILTQAANIRSTHQTEANEVSSRSHAICLIQIKNDQKKIVGKLIMVDLAGSERAQDCQGNSKQRKQEGAEINKSLLALKECIRQMDKGAMHVPFRGSKLTLVLRDSFLNKGFSSKIIMLACISPGSSSADHTVNTLRQLYQKKQFLIISYKKALINKN
ncbi:kinesin motor domain protein [Ichthyophthirius multifiliis]|uniref:Kinesin-like protein n=1 Tax=Ichthyophthirius multifiliis TaxID=5932 RepID=G0QZL3_ICHMU|nr:kinesin motor domain protein [Ichthyophthirius multifiliis]EGR29344.1 kinesin motor domain protein [Ichthyophthirius multifiliis]|eukprot:XP_004030580.1 kinesin motor domain protein [Ichthyophthirius multifiliis]